MFKRPQDTPLLDGGSRRSGAGRLLFRRFRRSQDGAAAVEFAFVAVPFFALLFAIFETALMFWTNQVLEESLSQVSRSLVTGQSRSIYTASTGAATRQSAQKKSCMGMARRGNTAAGGAFQCSAAAAASCFL